MGCMKLNNTILLTGLFIVNAPYAEENGQLRKQSVFVNGKLRNYLISNPINKKNKRLPILFALHGGGGNSKSLAKNFHFHTRGEAKNWIVVYPQASRHKFKSNWNDGRVHTQNGKKAVASFKDVEFILKIVKKLKSNYTIDDNRIYLTGISNGGFMAQRIAAEHAETFAAFASIISSMSNTVFTHFNPKEHLSVLMINGTQDPIIPYHGGGSVFGRKKLGYSLSVERVIDKWVEHNNLNPEAKIEKLADSNPTDNCTIERRVYTSFSNPNKVELLIMHGGGHTSAGDKQYAPKKIVGQTCYDINASDYLVEFLSKQQKH